MSVIIVIISSLQNEVISRLKKKLKLTRLYLWLWILTLNKSDFDFLTSTFDFAKILSLTLNSTYDL